MTEAQGLVKNVSISLLLNVAATFLVSVSMGMNAVLFPVTMETNGISTTLIGFILATETIAALGICFLLPKLLKYLGMRFSLVAVTLFRVPPLLFLPFFDDVSFWLVAIFVHGIGAFTFLILMQTWVNSLKFRKNAGLMIALYGTAVSLGLALGPLVLRFIDEWNLLDTSFGAYFLGLVLQFGFDEAHVANGLRYCISALISTLAVAPILLGLWLVPRFQFKGKARIWRSVMLAKGPMFAVAMAGVSLFGVTSFITIFGLRNGLSLSDASLLLTAFMLGSLILEVPLTWLSDYFDRRYIIVLNAFLCMVCAVYLPIAIYETHQAWTLLFIWGGVIGSIYSTSLTMIGERFSDEDLVTANAGYSIMESGGGTIGILLIGAAMALVGPDGLPYVIMFSSIVYFSFALTRYQVD
jgi:MFS family permease